MTQNPFEPGASVMDQVQVGPGAGAFEQPATAVIYALYANAAIDAIQIPMNLAIGEGEETLMMWTAVGVLQFAVFIAAVVLWCQWKMRAARNIRVFSDRHYEFTPGWAAGWYFVPFLNLVRPFQAMKEILSASSTNHDLTIVSSWWGAWILSNVLANVSTRIGSPIASAAASVAGIAAAILAVKVVNAVNQGQLETARTMTVR